jgi:hypothetical protein
MRADPTSRPLQLVLMVALSDFLALVTSNFYHPEAGTPLCTFQGWAGTYFGLTSYIWTGVSGSETGEAHKARSHRLAKWRLGVAVAQDQENDRAT